MLARDCSKWRRFGGDAPVRLLELLEARAFLSASLRLRKGQGRVYLMSAQHGFSKADALFLKHIVAQVFPMMENIELLARLALQFQRHRLHAPLGQVDIAAVAGQAGKSQQQGQEQGGGDGDAAALMPGMKVSRRA